MRRWRDSVLSRAALVCAAGFVACARSAAPDAGALRDGARDEAARSDIATESDTEADSRSDGLSDATSEVTSDVDPADVVSDISGPTDVFDAFDADAEADAEADADADVGFTVCGVTRLSCHPLDNRGCPAGQTCHFRVTPYGATAECLPSVAPSRAGAQCADAADCPLGYDCAYDAMPAPRCVPICCWVDPVEGDARCAAAPPAPCDVPYRWCNRVGLPTSGPTRTAPGRCGSTPRGFSLGCTPFVASGCPVGTHCVPDRGSGANCVFQLPAPPDAPCAETFDCGPGEVCVALDGGSRCRRVCDPTATPPAPSGAACTFELDRYCSPSQRCVSVRGPPGAYGYCDPPGVSDASVDAAVDAAATDAVASDAPVDAGAVTLGPCASADAGSGYQYHAEPVDRVTALATGLAREGVAALRRGAAPAEFPPTTFLTPAAIPAGVCVVDPSGTWLSASWLRIRFGFGPGERHAYSYVIGSEGRGSMALFSARAHGNLDGAGTSSTFEISGAMTSSGVTLSRMWIASPFE